MLPTPAIAALREKFPLIIELMALQPLSWFNPRIAPAAEALKDVGLTAADVAQASARLARFAPYLARAFPETQASGGIIESPVVPLPRRGPTAANAPNSRSPPTLAPPLHRLSRSPRAGNCRASSSP